MAKGLTLTGSLPGSRVNATSSETSSRPVTRAQAQLKYNHNLLRSDNTIRLDLLTINI